MKFITLDFETYYDRQYSLSKLTTEEYIRSDSFEVIGVSVQIDDSSSSSTTWFSGTEKETQEFLDSFDWENSLAIAHNAMFDMAILSWRFGIKPARIADTLSMARAIHGTQVGGSLRALTEHYGIGKKGTEVLNALGKRREDFSEEDLEAYAGYCKNDTIITYKLFKCLMAEGFPVVELKLIDLTLRMFTEPVLQVGSYLLEGHLDELKEKKATWLGKAGVTREQIMSNPQFAELLIAQGVIPPVKVSLTTGKETLAFAKTDEAFQALREHENPVVQILIGARLGVKSTIEETRTERFINIGNRGALPIPLRYYAAHTGRWGGDDKINMQNLPRGSILKNAMLAPQGYTFLDCDSSQIEARTLAWLAEQDNLVGTFAAGDDVYKVMASSIYGKPEEEINKDERFIGKTTILGCIGAGTRVLCETGWKPIEQVTTSDRLWDGENWVCHQGLLEKGLKETVSLCGSWLTPDHRILCGGKWQETQSVVQDESTLSQALVTGAAKLPLEALSGECGEALRQLSLNAIAGDPSIQSTGTTLKTLGLLAAQSVLSKQAIKKGIGSMPQPCQMIPIEHDSSTDFLLLSPGAITQEIAGTKTTGVGVYGFTTSGERTEQSSSRMYRHLKDGIARAWKWTASTMTKGTSQTTYGSQPEAKTCETLEASKSCSKKLMTYDLAYAGPNNRFTIWTDSGPVIAHNCGYGMGAAKFKAQLNSMGVELAQEECDRIIQIYRRANPSITKLWRTCNDALTAMVKNQSVTLGRGGLLKVEGKRGIRLPNGLYIKYPNLRKRIDEETGREELVYDTKRGRSVIPNRIYGGKVVENLCQALARLIIGHHLLLIAKKYKVVMTVHDAVGAVAKEDEAEDAMQFIYACMKQTPDWAEGLPLDCEGGFGASYGEC